MRDFLCDTLGEYRLLTKRSWEVVFREFSVTEGGRTFFPVFQGSHDLAVIYLYFPKGLLLWSCGKIMCPPIHSSPWTLFMGHALLTLLTYLLWDDIN